MGHRDTILLVFYVILFNCVCGFNLSPKPNYVLKDPKFKTVRPIKQSSYFGYSINLRENSVMVGAPRGQPLSEKQRTINEIGVIYKCFFNTSSCKQFVVDEWGNVDDERDPLKSEFKDHQWLGASMDGNSKDGQRFVVCAPRMRTRSIDSENDELMHGICYWRNDTLQTHPKNADKIVPLRIEEKQMAKDRTLSNYMYGEQGISVHITENDQEILIGAPGVYEWKGTIIRFKSSTQVDVPNPVNWKQDDDSYFGYALASGYFAGPRLQKILYVASAPQANVQQGEVYIFDIVDHSQTEKTIKIYYNFTSNRMGEYFGYALAADDFNGDGFYDLAICAPFHSKGNTYENGAVYIYRNLGESTPGKWSSNFALQTVLLSGYDGGGGRFGSSISRLGDINQDGFRDIAIGAPYEDNGAVYIYFGGPSGINTKPSQKLEAPMIANLAPFTPHTFGLALSKGSDIDGNKYLDLAIGAPNVERVYVYKSYPVVKVIARVQHLSKLQKTDKSFTIKVCWSLESKVLQRTGISIRVELDKKFRRAHFSSGTSLLDIDASARYAEKCQIYDAVVKFSDAYIFKPIDIEMNYTVSNKVQNSTEFCSKCVAVNPCEPDRAISKIVFATDCVNGKCLADLKLTSTVLNQLPFVKGVTNIIGLTYKIENFGESAYLAQINISVSESISFMKTPSSCKLDKRQLLCNINNGGPLHKGQVRFLNVSLDTTNFVGTEVLVKANAMSVSDESNDEDNHVADTIPLVEFSEVEISGMSYKPLLKFQNEVQFENVSNALKISNNGPTFLKHIDIVLSIPISYQIDLNTKSDFISLKNITVKSQYNNQQLEIEWTDGESGAPIEHDQSTRNVSNHDEMILKSFVGNNSILLDCNNSTTHSCAKAKFSVNNFKVGDDTPILIQLDFTINLGEIDKILTDNIDQLVIRPHIELLRYDDEEGKTMNVFQSHAFTIISKYRTIETPLWLYIASVLGGVLAFILITYALYKCGFFRRKKREELKILVRQSQIQINAIRLRASMAAAQALNDE